VEERFKTMGYDKGAISLVILYYFRITGQGKTPGKERQVHTSLSTTSAYADSTIYCYGVNCNCHNGNEYPGTMP
jgi:hypothetical protein